MIADDSRASGDEEKSEDDIVDELATASPPKDLRTLMASGHAVEQAVAQEHLRRRAYDLWEAAGRPAGDGAEFWAAAERELLAKHEKAHDKSE